MKTAMQELKDVIDEMIKNGGTEEDLFAVIAHIDNWAFEKEKEQIMKAVKDSYECTYNSCDSGCGGNIEIEFTPQEYYNQLYNQNK